MSEDKRVVTVRIPEPEYRLLRIVTTAEGTSMGKFCAAILIEELEKRKVEVDQSLYNLATTILGVDAEIVFDNSQQSVLDS